MGKAGMSWLMAELDTATVSFYFAPSHGCQFLSFKRPFVG